MARVVVVVVVVAGEIEYVGFELVHDFQSAFQILHFKRGLIFRDA
jgi:hypothetical protein